MAAYWLDAAFSCEVLNGGKNNINVLSFNFTLELSNSQKEDEAKAKHGRERGRK